MNYPSDKRRMLEITAVVFTAIAKIIFMDLLNWRLPFIAIITTAWLVYIVYRNKIDPGILKHWGFRTDNFWSVFRRILPYGILAVASCSVAGFYLETINLTWHIIPILILYPIWGVVQQFLVIALVAGNLNDLHRVKANKLTVVTVTALLFAIVHYPFYWLMAGTFFLALLYGHIYLKERNVFVLGIFHGWLGPLFFYTVVGRDPLIEVFGPLISIAITR